MNDHNKTDQSPSSLVSQIQQEPKTYVWEKKDKNKATTQGLFSRIISRGPMQLKSFLSQRWYRCVAMKHQVPESRPNLSPAVNNIEKLKIDKATQLSMC